MKNTVLYATIAFWCFMIGVVIAGTVGPRDASQQAAPGLVGQAPSSPSAASGAAKSTPTARKSYSLKDVARHATANDCWMAIGGKVYDFSAYIPQHPSLPEVMTRHCGTEATRAFETKDRGRPHGDYAKGLLAKYELGTLRD